MFDSDQMSHHHFHFRHANYPFYRIVSDLTRPFSVLPAPCYLYTVKFNPKNIDEVLIAGQNGYIYIYATFTDEQPQLLHELYISSCIINSIAFSANSAMMFAVCDDGFLYVFQHGEVCVNTLFIVVFKSYSLPYPPIQNINTYQNVKFILGLTYNR